MKMPAQHNASPQATNPPAFTIRTGTEACAGPREGVMVVFDKPQVAHTSKINPKSR